MKENVSLEASRHRKRFTYLIVTVEKVPVGKGTVDLARISIRRTGIKEANIRCE